MKKFARQLFGCLLMFLFEIVPGRFMRKSVGTVAIGWTLIFQVFSVGAVFAQTAQPNEIQPKAQCFGAAGSPAIQELDRRIARIAGAERGRAQEASANIVARVCPKLILEGKDKSLSWPALLEACDADLEARCIGYETVSLDKVPKHCQLGSKAFVPVHGMHCRSLPSLDFVERGQFNPYSCTYEGGSNE